MTKKKPNRRPAHKHLGVIDALADACDRAEIPRTAVKELIGIEYITLDKYMRKERNVNDEVIVRRMVVTTKLINDMIKAGALPLPEGINMRVRTSVILERVDEFLDNN